MRKIDPTYNACVKIDYYHALFWTIGNELIRQNLIADDGKSMGIAWCVYGERRRPSHEDDGLPLFMLKERKNADQEEVRFVYLPTKPITEEHLDLPPLPDLMLQAHGAYSRVERASRPSPEESGWDSRSKS